MKKIILLAVMVLAAFLLVTACAKQTPEVYSPSPSPSVSPSPSKSPSPSPSPSPSEAAYTNPLTGLPTDTDLSGKRPFAVMLNNLIPAQPQVGVADADIIYELLVEGGITRMLAVYQDISNVPEIGTVRSSRPYYLDLVQGLDAIYIHAGGSEDAYTEIRSRGIDNIDGVNGTGNEFYRDQERLKAAGQEHSMMTTGELITSHLSDYGYNEDHNEDYTWNTTFAEDGTPAGGESAETVTVKFSYYKTGVFEYNSDDALYYISQYGAPYVDGNTDEQVGVTNVVVIYVRYTLITGQAKGYLSAEMTGTGTGYYACGGQYIPITWSRESEDGQFQYLTEDGTEVVFGVGRSYINLVPMDAELWFE